MAWISAFAVFFVVWWLVLFVMLPFSVRTQAEADDVTLGTVASAPAGRHMLRAAIRTTLVTAVLVGGFFVLTRVYGYTFNDIPRLVPDFDQPR